MLEFQRRQSEHFNLIVFTQVKLGLLYCFTTLLLFLYLLAKAHWYLQPSILIPFID